MGANAAQPSPGTPGGPSEPTQVDYDIRAPKGGLQAAIEALMGSDAATRPNHIDVTISRKRGHRVTVRVYPDREAASWDHARPTLFHMRGGTCVQLNDDQEVGPYFKCSGRINTEVQTAPLETGKLGILYDEKETPL